MSAVDDKIAWQYTEIAVLKAKRNALAPIFSLPTELLYAVDSDALFNLKWTEIIVLSHLKLSGVAPLSFEAEILFPTYIEAILDHSERIRTLKLSGEAQSVYNLIATLPNYNLSTLSSLSVNPHYKRNALPEGFVEALPDALFDRLPSLGQVKLKDVDFPWTSLSGLNTLSLRQATPSLPALPRTFNELLDMLRSRPHLRTLKLHCIVPSLKSTPPLVDLQKLGRLELSGDVASCAAFLNHVHIPAAACTEFVMAGIHVGADMNDIVWAPSNSFGFPGQGRLRCSRLQIWSARACAPVKWRYYATLLCTVL